MIAKPLFAIASKLIIHPLHRLRRGMTLGVRVMAVDGQDRVLLIRHSYSPGWLFPGGGVERGETIWQAGARELLEEAAVAMAGRPELFGFYNNDRQMRGDHLAFLVTREFEIGDFHPNMEIAEARFFAVRELPEDVTGGTRRRVAEVFDGAVISENW
jgi:ADP-ribose pyrophosphatase YjhB (NUDIX family)